MSKLLKMAIEERKVTLLLSIFIIAYGIYSYYYLPRQESPDTASPAVQITTVFPGANAEDVEALITTKIEDEIAKLSNVDIIRSYSQDNVSIVISILESNADYDKAWDDLRIGIDNLIADLPEGAEIPIVNTELTKTPGLIISISSDDYDGGTLTDFAERVKSRINEVDGIQSVDIMGEQQKRITIKVDERKLYTLNLSIEDISKMIKSQNVVIPSGAIKTAQGEINVHVPNGIDNIKDFEDIVLTVSRENGSVVRLGDVAQVAFTYEEGSLYYTKNGRSAVMVTAYFEDNRNVVLIGDDVREVIDGIRDSLPAGIIFDEVLYQPQDVENSVNDFAINLLQGVLFVIVVILIGMGYRNAIVVSIAIPLTISIAFAVMREASIDLQQVSISALIIALGMLVDNAIVISDAVQVKINEGHAAMKAAYLGAKEQAIPVFSSTLTTIAAFTPLLSLPGEAGEFLSSLPFVVIVTLSASYIVAMLVTPALASLSLNKRADKKRKFFDIGAFYTGLLKFNLRRPLLTVIIILLMILGSLYLMFTQVDIRMFPYVDKDVFYVTVSNEVVGDIDNTHQLIMKAEEILQNEPEISAMTLSTGGGLPRFYLTAEFVMPAARNSQIYAEFDLSKSDRFNSRDEFIYHIQQLFDNQFIGGYATAGLLEINMPGPTIEARLSAGSEQERIALGDAMYNYLLDRHETMNVQISKPRYSYQYQIEVDNDRAIQHGLSIYDIQYQINMALNGAKVSVLNTAGKSYDIYLESNIETIQDLENIKIKSRFTDQKVLLKKVANVVIAPQLNEIRRIDRKNVVLIQADIRPQYGSGEIQSDLEQFAQSLDRGDVVIEYGGDQETISKYLSGLGAAAIFALIAIYVILLIQFNSFVQPFIILTTVPLALIGVVLALVVTRTYFTFTVGLGAASLIGIVVNNGILLIEYINRARSEGMSVEDACEHSAERRMRPILLSTITTIFGLIPLVFADSSFFSPMAIALIGGLLVATVMTLTVVPTVYSILTRFEKQRKKMTIDNV